MHPQVITPNCSHAYGHSQNGGIKFTIFPNDIGYYKIITTVERDTGKYNEFIAGIVYECAARVNNTGGNERVMFPRYRVLQW